MTVLSQSWSCGLTLENISFQISLCARAYLPIINEKNKDIRRDLYGGKKIKALKRPIHSIVESETPLAHFCKENTESG